MGRRLRRRRKRRPCGRRPEHRSRLVGPTLRPSLAVMAPQPCVHLVSSLVLGRAAARLHPPFQALAVAVGNARMPRTVAGQQQSHSQCALVAGEPMARTTLGAYRARRHFEKTTEPSGTSEGRPAEYPRFVIQKHAARRLQYHLRREHDGVFKSWAVTKRRSLNPADRCLAVEVEDHPLDYGDFEGTIPE